MNNNACDRAFINGQVVTVNERDEVVNCVAIRDNLICYAGPAEGLTKFIGPGTVVTDLQGKSLLPGFIDSHMHLVFGALDTLGITCKGASVKSIEDLKKNIYTASREKKPGEWIRGRGYNHNQLEEVRHPTRFDLDEAAPRNPVILVRSCGNICACNSMALDLAGINDDTPDPPGGIIEKKDGRATGILKSAASREMRMLSGSFSREEYISAIDSFDKKLNAGGLTSVHDAGSYSLRDRMLALQDCIAEKSLRTRVYAMPFSIGENLENVEKLISLGLRTGFGDTRLRLGNVKLIADGSSSGPSAATRQPYTHDPGNNGILCTNQDELDRFVINAHGAGLQIGIHAVGDKAIEMVLESYSKALKSQPRANHRHRIEHCGILDAHLAAKIRELELVVISNPVFCHEYGDGYLVSYGEERVNWMFACKTLLDKGIRVAAGSDYPVADYSPLYGIHTAVNRLSRQGRFISPRERVSLMEAIRIYTINGAYASFEENIKGSIEAGKLADLVVLSEPILDCPPESLGQIGIEMTMIDGEIVYPFDGNYA